MATAPAGSSDKIELYGLRWPALMLPIAVEMEMIKRGGRWQMKVSGRWAGEGLFFHYRRLQQLIWPDKIWHKWNNLLLEQFCEKRIIGVMGPASTGKTREACDFALSTYYVWPGGTTVICSSTEKETLEDRVWGEIKAQHKEAKARYPWLPGYVIDSRLRIVTDAKDPFAEDGRDFRNGMVGVPCKKGGSYVGLGAYSGRKNDRVILVADEGQFMPVAYVDAISNLNKNHWFRGIVLGNPKETTDALGKVCEPSAELGGWDGGIDQQPGTKSWPTRFPNGVCVQLPGSDSPNLDGTLGIPLITQEKIDFDIAFYGKDSLQYTMMDEGRMPRGQGLRRVITRQMCLKMQAMEEPVWKGEQRTRIGFLDAAYGAVGGDRCVFGELQFGPDVEGKTILALISTAVVPVSALLDELPEDQIANWVKEECKRRLIPPENFFFDSTGRGSLVGAFGRIWSPLVGTVEFGGNPSDRQVSDQIAVPCSQYYSKFVTELWFSVRLIIMARQFRGMTEEVMNEGCMREWGMVRGNRTEVETKDDMKVKMGRSPDMFDALVAGVEGARRRGFSIASNVARIVTEYGIPNWRDKLREQAATLRARHQLNYKA